MFEVIAEKKEDKEKAELLSAAMNHTFNEKVSEIQKTTGFSKIKAARFLSDCLAKGFWPTKIKISSRANG